MGLFKSISESKKSKDNASIEKAKINADLEKKRLGADKIKAIEQSKQTAINAEAQAKNAALRTATKQQLITYSVVAIIVLAVIIGAVIYFRKKK